MITRIINLMCILLFLCMIFTEGFVYSQTTERKTGFSYSLGPGWNVGADVMLGLGIDDHVVGKTTDDEDINISGGGGLGARLFFTYSFSQKIESSVGAAYQYSSLTPQVKNADGKFSRFIFDTSVVYRFPVSSSGLIKMGAGLGYYIPGDLDIDMSRVSGGAHNVYGYKNAVGLNVLGEYVGYINEKYSWAVGLKYYNVTYKLESARLSGVNIPLNMLPSDIRNEIGELDGSGVDLIVSIIWKFK